MTQKFSGQLRMGMLGSPCRLDQCEWNQLRGMFDLNIIQLITNFGTYTLHHNMFQEWGLNQYTSDTALPNPSFILHFWDTTSRAKKC